MTMSRVTTVALSGSTPRLFRLVAAVRIRPLMADVAARFTHMGESGAGLVAKLSG